MVFRAMYSDPQIDVVAINDLTDTKTLAHLLKYDSVHGKLNAEISHSDKSITVNGKEYPVYAQKDPLQLPWKQHDVDVVVESTGRFTKRVDASKHLQAGAKKILISAPSSDADVTIVKGVNEHVYDKSKHNIVNNASCTTNCLAPIVKVLEDNFGVVHGFMTTVHSYTADQHLVDAPHSDLRRARSAVVSLVPTSTGAAKAVAEVIPQLKGKLDGLAVRAPTPDGSFTDFVCVLKKPVTKDQVNWLFKEVSNYHLKGIIEYTDEAIVSVDIIGNPNSCIFDSSLTHVIDGTLLKIGAWYDNEWGYSNRMVDVVKIMMR